MEKLKFILITSVLTTTFFFCCSSGNVEDQNEQALQLENVAEGNKSLRSKSMDMYGNSYGGDKVDELFQFYLEQNEGLQTKLESYDSLNNQLSEFRKEAQKPVFTSNSYYQSAISQLTYMKDSTLSKTIRKKLDSHKEKFQTNTQAFSDLDSLNTAEMTSIRDIMTAVKVVKTMELMSEYQKTHMPDVQQAEAFNNALKETKDDFAKEIK